MTTAEMRNSTSLSRCGRYPLGQHRQQAAGGHRDQALDGQRAASAQQHRHGAVAGGQHQRRQRRLVGQLGDEDDRKDREEEPDRCHRLESMGQDSRHGLGQTPRGRGDGAGRRPVRDGGGPLPAADAARSRPAAGRRLRPPDRAVGAGRPSGATCCAGRAICWVRPRRSGRWVPAPPRAAPIRRPPERASTCWPRRSAGVWRATQSWTASGIRFRPPCWSSGPARPVPRPEASTASGSKSKLAKEAEQGVN